MNLTLRQLQIFIAIGQTGGTTTAAKSISLSQSAVSAALSELENLLNTQLFDRVGKRLVLNDNGRLLMPQARLLLDGAQSIKSQFSASGEPASFLLKAGASTTIGNYVIPALIARFRESVSAARVEIHIGNTSEIAAEVANFKVDIGFIEGPCHEPGLNVIPWLVDELVIVSSPNHSLARQQLSRKITLKDLRKTEWLLREPGSGTRETVEQVLLPYLHHLNEGMVFGNAEAIKHAVAQNMGLSCLSRCVVTDMLASKHLVVLNTPLPQLSRRFYLVYHKKKFLSTGLERFIHYCKSIGTGE
ncbi:MAG: LysR family transcriptional regulator [Rugosibacter sp.]|nr:LysR family transcriptional regulator [Rugosibacter sp.]